ncbi:MAG: hypothetical protein MJ161_05025 [Clostridia bacterium]|nr:hypothetical protein [Clostridia bacterium]
MKKNRLLLVLMSVIMACAMTLAFAGCGGDANTDEEAAETTAAAETETSAEVADSLLEDPEYDIYKVLEKNGLEDVLQASGVEYDVNQFSNITTEVAIKMPEGEELDGVAGVFMAYAPGDTEYESLPDYKIVGEQDGVTYVLMLPTDVRINTEDPQQSSDYEKLTEALKSFEIK